MAYLKTDDDGIAYWIGALSQFGMRAEGMIKFAVYPAADIVIEAIKDACPVSDGGGDLRDSCFLTDFQNKDGFIYTQIGWAGYDRNGVPNALKVNVLEHGRSDGKSAHPFIRKAAKAARMAATNAMSKAFYQKLNEIMKRG